MPGWVVGGRWYWGEALSLLLAKHKLLLLSLLSPFISILVIGGQEARPHLVNPTSVIKDVQVVFMRKWGLNPLI